MDRFVATPPYLLMTLLALRLMQGLGIDRSVRETRQLYLGALIKNYKARPAIQLSLTSSVCVFIIKLKTTAQSDPVLLVIVCVFLH